MKTLKIFKSKRELELEKKLEQVKSIVSTAMNILGSPGERNEYRAYVVLGQGMGVLFPDDDRFVKIK